MNFNHKSATYSQILLYHSEAVNNGPAVSCSLEVLFSAEFKVPLLWKFIGIYGQLLIFSLALFVAI
jgi:hypothetical protein